MFIAESESMLPGWKHNFPSAWIRIFPGSCVEELHELREAICGASAAC